MIIRKYRDLPAMYTADVGEVIEARLSQANPFVRAVVLVVKRGRNRVLRYDFLWMATDPRTSAVEGTRGHVYQKPDGPLMIRQITKGPTTGT